MYWRTRLSKAKHSLGNAWNASMKVLSIADRAHALAMKGTMSFKIDWNLTQGKLWGLLFKHTRVRVGESKILMQTCERPVDR